MKPRVYVETSIIGYLTSWPSGNLVIAANQKLTKDWWKGRREEFDIYISQFVVEESSSGDPEAARERLEVIKGLSELDVNEDVERFAETLMRLVPLPEKAEVDALHIATATIGGMDYLLTWNCRHIANPALRPRIETVCRGRGYEPPSICTPQEIMEI